MKLIFSDHEIEKAPGRSVASSVVSAIMRANSAGGNPIEIILTVREAGRLSREFGQIPKRIDGVRLVVE